MAKTVYLNNYSGLIFGYAVDTAAKSAAPIYDGDGHVIGTQVYVASLDAIAFSTLLEIGGVGQVVVTGTGTDGTGTPQDPFRPWFTCSDIIHPATDAYVRTPWNPSGALLYTRANNSVSLTYYLPDAHDLYFDTFKTTDSGLVNVTLDGVSLGAFDLHNASNILASVLLAANVALGTHTVVATASITPPRVFVYFNDFSMLEHVTETGGEYSYLGPDGTLDQSTNNFAGTWTTVAGYAYTQTMGDSVFLYSQLDSGGKVTVRVQKTPDSAIIGLGINGAYPAQYIDLYADPAVGLVEITLLDTAKGDAPGQYTLELRNTGTHNAGSSGFLFYFKSAVVYISRTNTQALILLAEYLRQVAAIRGDGAILDAYDSKRINFDSNALYACMGLLAAYQALGTQSYLTVVRDFLTWFATMQLSNPGVPFDDGSWKIGYQVNPNGPPTYIPAIAPYDLQGITEIRWVDAVQCLPSFILWWYWKLSGDNATLAALLPTFRKGIDGFIRNNYDPSTGFFFSSWQNKTGIGWQLLTARYSAGQNDVVLGLTALWLMTRSAQYARLAALVIRRFPGKFWDVADGHWYISLDGPAATPNSAWYPQPHGYTPFVQKQSRFFQPLAYLSQGLAAMEAYQTSEGGFLIPGYDAEHIFASFYVTGENQLAAPTNPADLALALHYIKSGQWLLTLGGEQVGGVVFSKRYPYLYTNQAGFACLALAGTMNPFVEQLEFSQTRMVMKQ